VTVIKRILVIEDDIELAKELAEALEDKKFSVDYSNNPYEGISLIKNGNYDIVLLDNKMPNVTGVEILRKLKLEGIRKPILLITGRPFIESLLKEQNLYDMVGGIVSKPIKFKFLVKKIEKLA
jgi:DNA-binding response OmpR family regulator